MLALALLACKPVEPTPSGTAIVWDEVREALVLSVGGRDRLVLPLAGVEVGVVQGYDDLSSYDPWFEDAGARYLAARSAAVTGDESGFDVVLGFEDGDATLSVMPAEGHAWDLRLVPDAGMDIAYFRLSVTVDGEEGFYGLGEHLDGPNHRGKRRAMQLEVDPASGSGYNEAHVPVPLIVGTSGWGLLVADDHPAVFDVATSAPNVVTATVGTGEASGAGLAFHLYEAADPLDVYLAYYQTTGFPALPAPWATGPLVWRNENESQAQVEGDLAAMRDLDLPCSGIWIDRPYATGVNTFDFDPAKFTDAQAMIDAAHAAGFRMALWHTPYADPDDAAVNSAYAESHGFYPPQHPPPLTDWGPLLDLTNQDAVAWWRGLLGNYTSMGVEGYKLDFAEDVIVGLNGNRLPWTFGDGSDERTMHKGYTRAYHATYRATLPADGGFLLCRTGTWGEQVNGCIIWPGDLDASLSAAGEEVERDGDVYTSVGGLEASLATGLSVQASGYPFYASDTGGYRHSPPNKETFTRWFEQTALSAAMQIGVASSDVAWEFTEANGFDAEMLGWYRDYTRLHLRLFPYTWTHANALRTTGRPSVRAFGLAHPETGLHPSDTYFLGDDLLVAPVMRAGAVTRDVPVPSGAWIDWFTGEVLRGPGTFTVDAPLGKLPLYLRAGGIVPLLRPTIDTLAPASDAGVESYANDAGVLYVRAWPVAHGEFTLYDGTRLTVDQGWHVTYHAGSVFDQGVVFELVGVDVPPAVSIDGVVEDPTTSDEAGGMVIVQLASSGRADAAW